MKLEMFSVYDSAAKAFLEPFFAPTVDVAIRMFRRLLQNEDHQFRKFPEDYTLFQLGCFHQDTGLLEALPTPHNLGIAMIYIDNLGAPSVNGPAEVPLQEVIDG